MHTITTSARRLRLLACLGLATLGTAKAQTASSADSITSPTAVASERREPTESQRRCWLPAWFPAISGTIRAKAEVQTERGETHFQVRNARVALDGNVTPIVIYRAEIDLSDEGRIRMLDAYAGLQPSSQWLLRLGQMRVPFSIDAHRSPHVQYFANRSFIAKQVGDVRDVGFTVAYSPEFAPLKIEGGLFNGSGLTNQEDYWTRSLNFSAKLQYMLPFGLTLQASMQRVSPTGGAVYLYDCGATLQLGRWTLEAEYLRKHYRKGRFHPVGAFNSFVVYDLPLRSDWLRGISFLARYDRMDDHSSGALNEEGALQVDDAARQRLTAGVTLRLAPRYHAYLRLNYEKYFYDQPELALVSERDKAVVEIVIRFPNKEK